MDVIPYIVLLIVPVLGRMSDQNADVRTMATHCFATLIRLLPLEVIALAGLQSVHRLIRVFEGCSMVSQGSILSSDWKL